MKLFLLSVLSLAKAYFVEIDAHKEECFHEKVSSGAKVCSFFDCLFFYCKFYRNILYQIEAQILSYKSI